MDNQQLLSISDLFKKSFEIYKPRIWKMLLLGLIAWLGSIIMLALFGTAGIATLFVGRGFLTFNLFTVLLLLIGLLLVIIINLWVQVALIYAVKEENLAMSAKDLLMVARGKMASYYWVAFLKGIVVLAGFIVLIIPGIIFSVWFSLCQYAFVFDGVRGGSALSRSKTLVRGYWWAVFGRVLLLALVAILISSLSKLGFFINSLFTMPFGIIYMYVIYEDLKRIKSSIN